jgi:hypothetical protein
VYFLLLCLVALPLPPGKPPFAVQLNNNNKKATPIAASKSCLKRSLAQLA